MEINMVKHNYNIKLDIPQDADSARYFIPEGYTAKFEDGVLIVEPKESDDERIRKHIVTFIMEADRRGEAPEEYAKWLAYLEKQKAKERLDRMAPIYNDKESFESALEKAWKYYNESASRTVDSFEDNYIECVFSKGFREGFLYKEKQKEQKSAEKLSKEDYVKKFKALCDAYEIKLPNREYDIYHLCKDLHKLFGDADIQKPVEWNSTKINGGPISTENNAVDIPCTEWSEEDKKTISDACCWIAEYAGYLMDKNWGKASMLMGLTEKLKSLRPQSKVEWSEEDEKILHSIKQCVYNNEANIGTVDKNRFIDWLESLHPSWKPSKEQMKALNAVNCDGGISYVGQQNDLISLYNDLKKLI